MAAATILVIDDSAPVREALAATLRRGGHEVVTAAGGEEGLRLARERAPDLVVLDLHMPDLDGWAVLERLRERSDRPVLMLTAAADERSRVRGLLQGADDYLVKPASPAELLARVVALLRRSRGSGSGSGPEPAATAVYEDALVRVNPAERSVRVHGEEVALSPTELRLLVALVRRPGVAVAREQLLREVWEGDGGAATDHVKLYVGYLRRKLAAVTEEEPIETVRGFGYRWRAPAP